MISVLFSLFTFHFSLFTSYKMNYERIYKYRFEGIDSEKKLSAWKFIAAFIYKKLKRPKIILDPAAGDCEFINLVGAPEKWAIDMNPAVKSLANKDVKVIVGNNMETELPTNYFDAAYVSNFLEHLS